MSIILPKDIFPAGRSTVEVKGSFGWSECPPADIKICAILLTVMMWKGHSNGDIGSESIGDYSINFKNEQSITELKEVKKILDKYKKL